MIWLIALVLFLQMAFHWLLEPVIRLLTPLFELTLLPWLFAITGLWLLAGHRDREQPWWVDI